MQSEELSQSQLEDLWTHHHAQWRDPAQVMVHWNKAGTVNPQLLQHRSEGLWWDILEYFNITLLVTREYEHLVLGIQVQSGKPCLSYISLPHPSGLAVNRQRNIVHIASTRNPNQVYDFMSVVDVLPRQDISVEIASFENKPLIPVSSHFFPGCLYMHDLVIMDNQLYANIVGHNAIARLDQNGQFERVWWPKCIEIDQIPVFSQNHIQLNSIAANKDIESSYFSASSDKISALRPGHPDFPVDKQGVIFSGATREVIARGLTRPHSTRLHQHQIWVDNSGYGEFGFVEDGKFIVVTPLPGWTRGLCFYKHIAFVGTSQVIPRFRQYAPGLDVNSSLCGLHAVDTESGNILGSLLFPHGNQIFAIEWVNAEFTSGFPFQTAMGGELELSQKLFYAFSTRKIRNG